MHLKSCSAAQTLVGSTHGSYTAWLNMSMKKCGTYRFRLGAVIHLMHAQARGQIHRVPTRTLAQFLECMEQKVAARPVDPPNELFRTQT